MDNLDIILHSAKIEMAHHITYSGNFFGLAHRHLNIYQLSYIISGRSRTKIGKKVYKVKEGEAVFVNAGQWHRSYREAESERFELLEIKFSLNKRISLKIPPVTFIYSRSEFLDAFHSLVNEFHMRRLQREKALKIHLAHLFLTIFRNRGKGEEKIGKSREKISQAIAFIQKNYRRKIKIEDIAKEVMISSSSLSHSFKEFTGISPIGYLTNYRLSRALWLMGKSSRNLFSIAGMTGFSSPYYFSRLFKKRYNLSPRRYAHFIYDAR